QVASVSCVSSEIDNTLRSRTPPSASPIAPPTIHPMMRSLLTFISARLAPTPHPPTTNHQSPPRLGQRRPIILRPVQIPQGLQCRIDIEQLFRRNFSGADLF